MTYPQHPEQPGANAPHPPFPRQPNPQQPQPYPQQGYGAPQYGQAPQPYPGTSQPDGRPSTDPSDRNPLGLIALILGAVPLVLGLFGALLSTALIRTGDYTVVGAASAAINGLSLVVGVAAVVVGAIALARKDRPKALAGIGLGLGAAAVAGAVTGGLYSLLASLPF